MTRLRLWLPPKVWLHGSQSTINGRCSARNGQTCRIICWFDASIRCVFSTPLGVPVEPEVKRILATASGAKATCAWFNADPGTVAIRSSSDRAPGRSPEVTMAGTAPTASSAAANFSALSANTAPGLIRSVIALIAALHRVGDADRRDRNAGHHRADGHQQVVNAISGQDQQRPIRPKSEVEQPLADRLGGRDRLAVVAGPPRAGCCALRDERVIGISIGPCPQAMTRDASSSSQGSKACTSQPDRRSESRRRFTPIPTVLPVQAGPLFDGGR